MLEKHFARAARWMHALTVMFAVVLATALGACRDTMPTEGIAGPTASQSKGGNGNVNDQDDDDDEDDDNGRFGVWGTTSRAKGN